MLRESCFQDIKRVPWVKMVARADVAMFRPEEELCRFSRLAYKQSGLFANTLKKDIPAEERSGVKTQKGAGNGLLGV